MMEKLAIDYKKENLRDRIFYSLVKIMVNDFYKIQEEYDGFIPHEIGTEFNTHLHGAFILLGLNEQEIKKYCRKKLYYDKPIKVCGKNFVENLEDCVNSDGARIVQDKKIIMRAGIYGVVEQAEKKLKGDMDMILEKYTESSSSFVGERLTNALAAGLAMKKPVFTISQTIQPSAKDVELEKKKYSKIGTGKVMEFGPNGLVRKVKLENGDETPLRYCLKNNVYIKQWSYEFVDGIRLIRPSYLFIDDINKICEVYKA